MYAAKDWGESYGKCNIDRTHKFDIIHPKRVKYCAIQVFAYIGVLDSRTPRLWQTLSTQVHKMVLSQSV